jgi:hypothetical protein
LGESRIYAISGDITTCIRDSINQWYGFGKGVITVDIFLGNWQEYPSMVNSFTRGVVQ